MLTFRGSLSTRGKKGMGGDVKHGLGGGGVGVVCRKIGVKVLVEKCYVREHRSPKTRAVRDRK